MKYFITFIIIAVSITFSCTKKGNIALNNVETTEELIIAGKKNSQVKEIMYVNSIEGLRVRKGPGIEYDRIFLLEDKEKIHVLKKDENEYIIDGITGNWFLIKTDIISGWVFSGFLINEKELNMNNVSNVSASDKRIPYSFEELDMLPSLWQIISDDNKYVIEDRGTSSPPRNVIVKNRNTGELVFFGNYYNNINLQGNSIETVIQYGEYYAGKWSINKNLDEAELVFAKTFLEVNKPPEELIQTADLAKGNGLGVLIIIEYNFETKEKKIIRGDYYRTM
ncbi:MAG: SH3 domain-containing protein [Treponema sp.]|jgi:hypothetical protein|nr:SH3 domain-containing protein [Treponema sp.]